MKRLMLMCHVLMFVSIAATEAAAQTRIATCQTISQSGSYVLARNLGSNLTAGNCLVVTADYVTIDLAGFVITGDGTGGGISAPHAVKGIVIQNGAVINFNDGIRFCGGFGPEEEGGNDSITISRMRVNDNLDVAVRVCGSSNLVKDTVASGNGWHGLAIDGESNVVTGNTATGNAGQGIIVFGGGSTVIGNTAVGNGGIYGLHVGAGTTVMNNTARHNTGPGLRVVCPSNVIGNTVTANGAPIEVAGAGCLFEHNVIAP